jgi:hypothetical protein
MTGGRIGASSIGEGYGLRGRRPYSHKRIAQRATKHGRARLQAGRMTPFRGGVIYYAERVGLDSIREQLVSTGADTDRFKALGKLLGMRPAL